MPRTSQSLAALATLATLGLAATSAHAQTVAAAKATDIASLTATPAASVTDNPVVTFIIQSGMTTGATPTPFETFLVQDGTDAIEVYKDSTTSYAPAVGDTVSLSGAVTSFHSLFELENVTTPTPITLTTTKTGTAAVPAPTTFTTVGLTNGSPVGLTQQSMLGNLNNVTFSTTGAFASGISYTVTDALGSATVYIPSTDTAIIGTTIPTGPVNIYGYLGQYGTKNVAGGTLTTFGATATSNDGYEFDPLSFSTPAAAPEPSGMVALALGAGVLGLMAARRKVTA